jgi:hypothetical protein
VIINRWIDIWVPVIVTTAIPSIIVIRNRVRITAPAIPAPGVPRGVVPVITETDIHSPARGRPIVPRVVPGIIP